MTGAEIRSRLDALGRRDPSLAPTLALYEVAIREADDPAWDVVVEPPAAPAAPPRLAAAALHLDPARAGEWVSRLVAGAGDLADGAIAASAARLDPTALILAAVRLDSEAVEEMARRAGVLAESVAALGHLAAMPLLAAAGRRLGPPPVEWDAGSCPLCGAWPALAELRGLDGERHLRCGRCGADWRVAFLRCVFCGTRDHEQLGALVPESEKDRRKVDVCRACKGFLKTIPTLKALDPRAVVLEDLATVDLDLVAIERGFARPARPPAAPVTVRVSRASTT